MSSKNRRIGITVWQPPAASQKPSVGSIGWTYGRNQEDTPTHAQAATGSRSRRQSELVDRHTTDRWPGRRPETGKEDWTVDTGEDGYAVLGGPSVTPLGLD
jgi:hypothetical protein